jgi:hypothetical protein
MASIDGGRICIGRKEHVEYWEDLHFAGAFLAEPFEDVDAELSVVVLDAFKDRSSW